MKRSSICKARFRKHIKVWREKKTQVKAKKFQQFRVSKIWPDIFYQRCINLAVPTLRAKAVKKNERNWEFDTERIRLYAR